ncbi:hypothetical protein CDV36_014358 [Fusarium kuroshium]|uniref:PD-(D/E)XK nuclease-like domain-containing protein n=1 Tax=Fusarium kuroshium TaxID=2010991 RepID=A0A3M2RI52_9HYPO|nr:hypothetical protein CDV36_014358 [Fusarium kuroshium]
MPEFKISVPDTCSILLWLEDVEFASSRRPLKRRRALDDVETSRLNARLPTPMMDIKDSSSISSSSRRRSLRRNDAQTAETTPPLSTRQIPVLPPPNLPAPSAASSSHSPNSPPRSVSPTRTVRERQSTQCRSTAATSMSSPSRRRPKDMVGLELSSRPVQYKGLGLNSKDLPDTLGIRNLYRQIQRANINPRGLLPLKFKQFFLDSVGDLVEDFPDIFIDDAKCAPYFAEAQLHQVLDITHEAVMLDGSGASEATWNSDIHSQVLKLALAAYRQRVPEHGIQSRNITTAHIDTILRLSRGEGESLPDKLVDFALTVSIPDPLYRAVLRDDPIVQSVNQTTYGPVCFKPIGVGIETKVKTGTDDRQQLTLWTAAWFQRQSLLSSQARASQIARQQSLGPQSTPKTAPGELDQQSDSDASLQYPTVVPLLSIRGNDWSILFMEDHQNQDGYAYTLYEGPIIGDTKTPLGCYKIIHALLRLCEWLNDDFQPAMARFYTACCLANDLDV